MLPKSTLQELKWRFWNKVNLDSDDKCWLWNGPFFVSGYGSFSRRGFTFRAHRLAWVLINGTIPEGLGVLHKCNVKSCVNPEHLYLGTQKQNMQDASRDGLMKPGRGWPPKLGEKHPMSKVTADQVREIRKRATNGESPIDIAGDYPIKTDMVRLIIRRLRWTHL